MDPILDPVTATPPAEVSLNNAPLVRVIAQVRFPMVAAIGQQKFIAPFQEAIRKKYPVLRPEHTQNIILNPGAPEVKTQTVWRFLDVSANWRVSLAPDFLALETSKYTNRTDFIDRLNHVVSAAKEHVEPSLVDRLGVRYINRISGEEVNDIASLVRSELTGVLTTPLGGHVEHVLSETMIRVDNNQVMARWGCVPPKVTVDPTAIEPVDDRSWILDVDMFTATPFAFEVERISNDALSFASRVYTFFRWAVTEEFLRRHGGNP
ncbi:MAG: TIGR04255 family protein [Planctomycetota bacterium]|nr:TIGR04255 family protein [Planctomycetota bacterium]